MYLIVNTNVHKELFDWNYSAEAANPDIRKHIFQYGWSSLFS